MALEFCNIISMNLFICKKTLLSVLYEKRNKHIVLFVCKADRRIKRFVSLGARCRIHLFFIYESNILYSIC